MFCHGIKFNNSDKKTQGFIPDEYKSLKDDRLANRFWSSLNRG